AFGMVEQPAIYASKHGPVGFLKGVGKAMVGAVFKPVVGVGDAAVLVMNHMSDMTSNKEVQPKIPRRLRHALPSRLSDRPNAVELIPYDERAAKAQKIVTASESIDDVYIGHINIPSHLIIASKHFLWAIDRRSRDPWYGAAKQHIPGLKSPQEGVVETAECKGTLTVTANTDAGSAAQVTIDKFTNLQSNFTISTHPKVDKKQYESTGVLALKGGKCAPLTDNCWPEDEGGSMNVNVELELTNPNLTLKDVNMLLTLGTTDPPVIADIDGVYKHNPRTALMCWHFDQIDASNSSATLEFSIPGQDADAFFPVQIMFQSETFAMPYSCCPNWKRRELNPARVHTNVWWLINTPATAVVFTNG
ncbi:MAG: hypothetical protein SGBAC_013586, partial [Bacillariaceae sp.]